MKTLSSEVWRRLIWWRHSLTEMKYTKKEDEENLLFGIVDKSQTKTSVLFTSMSMPSTTSMLLSNTNNNNNNNNSKVSFYQLFVLIVIFSFIFLFGTFFYIRLNHNFAYPPSAGWSSYETVIENTPTTNRIEYLSDQFRLVRAKAKQRLEHVKLELHNLLLKVKTILPSSD